jgi:uncharacterized membrane protein HdeD (DUF308 family)
MLMVHRRMEGVMEITFARGWRPLALRGCAGIFFGVVALLWPNMTLTALVLLFGAYSLADGLLALMAAVGQEARHHRWALALEGLVCVGIGLAAIVWTSATTFALVVMVAVWAMLTGALELLAAAKLRSEIPGEWLLGAAGAGTIVLGLAMILWPAAGAFVLAAMLAGYAIFFGGTMLMLALDLRRLLPQSDVFSGRRSHGAV